MEFLAVQHGEPDRAETGFRIIRIHVDDRRIEALGEIARVVGRPAFHRVGRESDLVVEKQMNRPARRVSLQPRQVERLGDDALARERGVAVQQDGQRDVAVVPGLGSVPVSLIGARPPLDDRIDGLEVAGIRR